MQTLNQDIATNFARIALGHVAKEYPHKLDHVMNSDEDVLPPRVLHPVFFGSFDWHSCVHGWWTLLTLRRLFPEMEPAGDVDALAQSSFTAEKLGLERAYLDRAGVAGFERPYGWGWLLYLHLEASRHERHDWAQHMEPMARKFAEMFKGYLAKLTYPITVGTHFNTSFALVLAREWGEKFDPELVEAIDKWSRDVFSDRRDYRGWEPGGDEFLSPALNAALLMSKVMEADEFGDWFDAFLPQGRMAEIFTPATVSDRSDGKIAHLDGLNLSRAWCLRGVARVARHRSDEAEPLAQEHLNAALDHVAGDYMGEHWLASFALLAML